MQHRNSFKITLLERGIKNKPFVCWKFLHNIFIQNENIKENIFLSIHRFCPQVFSLSLEFAQKHQIADWKFSIFVLGAVHSSVTTWYDEPISAKPKVKRWPIRSPYDKTVVFGFVTPDVNNSTVNEFKSSIKCTKILQYTLVLGFDICYLNISSRF